MLTEPQMRAVLAVILLQFRDAGFGQVVAENIVRDVFGAQVDAFIPIRLPEEVAKEVKNLLCPGEVLELTEFPGEWKMESPPQEDDQITQLNLKVPPQPQRTENEEPSPDHLELVFEMGDDLTDEEWNAYLQQQEEFQDDEPDEDELSQPDND